MRGTLIIRGRRSPRRRRAASPPRRSPWPTTTTYLEEDSAKKLIGTERDVLAEIKNILGGIGDGDAESSGSVLADHMEDAKGLEEEGENGETLLNWMYQ